MVAFGSGSVTIDQLMSDLDFKGMIQKLATVESRHVEQLMQWRTDWSKRVEAFSLLREDLTNMRTTLASINSIDKFLIKNTESSKVEVATATATGNSTDGIYNLSVNQIATSSSWSMETGLLSKFDEVNSSGAPQTLQYTYKGKQVSINVPSGTTMEGLVNLINRNPNNPGVKAAYVQSPNGLVFQLRGMDTGANALLTIDSSTLTTLPVSGLQYSWEMTMGTATLNNIFTDGSANLNPTTENTNFTFIHNGTTHTVTIEPNQTLDQLISAINTKVGSNIASHVPSGAGVKLQLEAVPTLAAFNPVSPELTDSYTDATTKVNTTGGAVTYTYEVYGKTETVQLRDEGTLEELKNLINAKHDGVASIVSDGAGGVKLDFNFQDKPGTIGVSPSSTNPLLTNTPPTSNTWLVQYGQNAQVRINGWPASPNWLESETNTLSEVIDGMTFNLRSKGDTNITVALDTATIVENVQKFVQAVNDFRALAKALTEFDADKSVVDQKYSESLFDMQKGSILTGNYGVQMISSSLKQAVAGQATGFTYQETVDGYLTGDIFSSLSQIGIMTNADPASKMYGMLEIKQFADGKGGMTFLEALQKDPQAVAELFASKDQGKSHSQYIGYNSHVGGVTKPGTYDVSYSIDAGGVITGTINGKPAKYYEETKQLGLVNTDDPAAGLLIDIYELPQVVGESITGQVSIREGKINQLLNMLDGQEGILNKQKGTLGILERNYTDIIKNIDAKITREDERLSKWEQTMILKFSRLEGVLAKYNSMQEGLKTQLEQLNSKG